MIRTMSAIMLFASAGLLTAAAEKRRADADALIAARQAAFKLSASTFTGIKATIAAGGDVTGAAFPANAMADWARAMPGLFPAGSDGGTSRALPGVWANRVGFEKAAANFAAESAKLADLAKANDKGGFAAQWAVVGGTCGSCHTTYRQPEKPRSQADEHPYRLGTPCACSRAQMPSRPGFGGK